MNFTGNLARPRDANKAMFFIIEEAKKRKHSRSFSRNCEDIVNSFSFNMIPVQNDSI